MATKQPAKPRRGRPEKLTYPRRGGEPPAPPTPPAPTPAPAPKPVPTAPAQAKAKPQATKAKAQRRARVAWADGRWAVVVLTDPKGSSNYLLQRLRGDLHEVTKLENGRRVSYLTQVGEKPSCACDGFVNHGHCRHVEALTALLAAAKL